MKHLCLFSYDTRFVLELDCDLGIGGRCVWSRSTFSSQTRAVRRTLLWQMLQNLVRDQGNLPNDKEGAHELWSSYAMIGQYTEQVMIYFL